MVLYLIDTLRVPLYTLRIFTTNLIFFSGKMATGKKFYNLESETDIEEIHKLLFDESSDENVNEFDNQNLPPNTSTVYDVEEEFDTDGSEAVEERLENSESEQSDVDLSSAEEDEEDFYIATRKKNRKIVERFSWKKTPFPSTKKNFKTKFNQETSRRYWSCEKYYRHCKKLAMPH